MPAICTKPLTAGEVIFESKPLIHVLDLEYKGKFCDNCVERSDQLKRCSKCLQMYYCDKSCQTMDWKYHKNECKVFRNQLFSLNRCSLEERVILRLWLCVKSDETFATKRHQLFDGSDISINDIKEKVKEVSKMERFLFQFLVISKNFEKYGLKFDSNELLLWFAVFDYISLLKIVSFDKTSIDFQIGSGLYLQLSHISHSCIPNTAVIKTKGLSLQLRAMKSIGFGEEITRTYISLVKNKIGRQMELKTDYAFDCNCDKCVKNLDSEVDYKIFDCIVRQLKQYSITGTNLEELSESVSKLIPSLNAIYGEYNSLKTLDLYSFLMLLLNNKYPNQELIKQLTDSIKEWIPVTHGESHYLNNHFQTFIGFHEFQRLFTLFRI